MAQLDDPRDTAMVVAWVMLRRIRLPPGVAPIAMAPGGLTQGATHNGELAPHALVGRSHSTSPKVFPNQTDERHERHYHRPHNKDRYNPGHTCNRTTRGSNPLVVSIEPTVAVFDPLCIS